MPRIDLEGETFGRLSVLSFLFNSGRTAKYLCRCACGSEIQVLASNLRTGNTQSCGCLRKERNAEYCTKPLFHVVARQVFNYYRRNALDRKLHWGLSFEDLQALILKPCFYCGLEGVTVTTTRHSSTREIPRTLANNGVDRLDNSVGYVPTNCVPCCKHCNRAKHAMTYSEFKDWVSRVHHHLEA